MWVSLPVEVRYRIRAIFDIPKSGITEVHDAQVISDGTTHEDFKSLTTEKMQAYLNSDSTDFHKLFDTVIAKVSDEVFKRTAPAVQEEVKEVAKEIKKKITKK